MTFNNSIITNFDFKLKKYFAKSSYIHLGIFLLFIISSVSINFFNEKRKKDNIKIVESSVRVDLIAMPDMTIKELKAMGLPRIGQKIVETAVKPKEIVTKNPNDFQLAKKKKNFLSMMKTLAKKKAKAAKNIKSRVKKNKKEGSLEGIDRGRLKDLILQGNKLSKGTNITGSGAGGTDAFSRYLGKLPSSVKPFWTLPSYLLGKNYTCRVRIFLSADGKLIKSELYETSGNKEYDGKAMLAVKQASPFPKLAEEFKDRGLSGDIVLGFPL